MGAFEVFWAFSHAEDVLSGHYDMDRWIRLTYLRLNWIVTLAALTVISLLLLNVRQKIINPIEFLLLIYGIGLFGAYSISNWNSEPRYFAPALVILTIATIILFPPSLPKKITFLISVILISMFTSSGLYLYKNIIKVPLRPYFDATEYTLKPDQVVILSTAKAWNKQELDFLNIDNGRKANEGIAKSFKKKLYLD